MHLAASAVLDETGEPLYVQASLIDITQQKEAEDERQRLEAQLRQAQKMEAVGELAGGVAHDFNNLLQVINGYCSLALQNMGKEDPSYGLLETVLGAGDKLLAGMAYLQEHFRLLRPAAVLAV